jgi:hypothetical protein
MNDTPPNTRIMLNPLEEEILQTAGEWIGLEQVHEFLLEHYPPARIRSAVAFLRRRLLLEEWRPEGSVDGQEAIYRRTALGMRVLAHQRGGARVMHVV